MRTSGRGNSFDGLNGCPIIMSVCEPSNCETVNAGGMSQSNGLRADGPGRDDTALRWRWTIEFNSSVGTGETTVTLASPQHTTRDGTAPHPRDGRVSDL